MCSLGLLLGTDPPVMMPNGALSYFFHCAGFGVPRADVPQAGGQDGGGDALQGPGHQRHPLPAPDPPQLRQERPKGAQAPSGKDYMLCGLHDDFGMDCSEYGTSYFSCLC